MVSFCNIPTLVRSTSRRARVRESRAIILWASAIFSVERRSISAYEADIFGRRWALGFPLAFPFAFEGAGEGDGAEDWMGVDGMEEAGDCLRACRTYLFDSLFISSCRSRGKV
jgi:hypothetical protein